MTRTTPARVKAKPVFDPDALGDEIDRMWPGTKSAEPPTPAAQVGLTEAGPAPVDVGAGAREREQSTDSGDGAEKAPAPKPTTRAPLRSVGAPKAAANVNGQKRFRPPEALLSGEVYDALYQHQLGEKTAHRGHARPMGVIVLDAIEKHASRLQVAWTECATRVGEGALFERPVSSVVPPRRRHVVPARNIVLSGVTPANAERLDALVEQWGSGTRSALVEQALRYEFKLA